MSPLQTAISSDNLLLALCAYALHCTTLHYGIAWLMSLSITVNNFTQLIGWFDVLVSLSVTEAEWYVFDSFSDLYPNAIRVIETFYLRTSLQWCAYALLDRKVA